MCVGGGGGVSDGAPSTCSSFLCKQFHLKVKNSKDHCNVIAFIRATDHEITMLYHVINNCRGYNHSRFH